LVSGPLVLARVAGRARGALLPLERIGTVHESHYVDQMAGGGFSLVVLDDIDPAELESAGHSVPIVLVGSRSEDPGARALALWLVGLRAKCALIRPDRVVLAIGSTPHKLLQHPLSRAAMPLAGGSKDDPDRIGTPKVVQ